MEDLILLKKVTEDMPSKELVDTLNNNFANLYKEMRTHHDYCKGKFDGISGQLKEMRTTINGLQSDTIDLKSDMVIVKSKIEGLETNMDKLLTHFGIK